MSDISAFDSEGLQYGFDATSITLASTCPRKYQYKMIEGWQPENKSVHLIFGGLYASALEHFHQHIAAGMDREDAIIEVVHEALIASWDRETGPWVSNHNTKTRPNLVRTIVWYLEHFKDDEAKTMILSNGEAGVEYSFKLPVDDGIVFAGHIDRMVEYAGKPYVQDQKTSGATISPRYFEGFNPDVQFSMYSFAGRMIFNIPVTGVMIDAAQIAVGFSRFERGFTFRSEPQLEEWYDESLKIIHNIRGMTKENYFPMNRTACGNYGGCEFRDVCSHSPHIRNQKLKARFVKGEIWNPMRAR